MDNGEWDPDVLTILAPQGDYLLVAPASSLIGYAGWQWISKAALPGLVASAKAFRAATGRALYVAEAFRSLETQQYYVDHPPVKGSAVARAGTSIHGFGLAIDIWSGINEGFNTPEHLTWESVSAKYGWRNTGRNFGEPWHQEFSVANVDPASAGGTTPIPTEDELPSTSEVADAIFNDPRFGTIVNQESAKVINGSAFQAAVKKAVDAQFASSLSGALDTVTTPYSDSTGVHTTSLRDWYKNVRNKVMSL